MRGKGLPDIRHTRKVGDQLVQVTIDIPKKISERQKQLLREFDGKTESTRPAAAPAQNKPEPEKETSNKKDSKSNKSFFEKLKDKFSSES